MNLSQDSWELVADIGFCVVIFGVALEIIDLIAKWRKEHGNESILVKDAWWLWWIEAASIIFVVIGLAVEFIGGFNASQLARKKIENITQEAKSSFDKAKSAEDDAGKSTVIAAQIETTNAQLFASNLVLQARVETLQARRIDINQEKKFIALLKNSPKHDVKVCEGDRDGETDDYASEISIILNAAGYTNEITQLGAVRIPSVIGQTIEDYPLVIEVYAASNDWKSISLPGVIFKHDYATLKTAYFLIQMMCVL